MTSLLTWIAFTPLLGALCVLATPRERANWVRALALLATLVPLALASWACSLFETGTAGLQFVERADWLLSLRAEYHVGVDGLSIALVWLATLTSFVAVAAGARGGKASYALLLLLELAVVGVLVAQDLLLWFVCCNTVLLAIGLQGAIRGARTATRFVLHASAGSALMLVAIVALRLDSGTFSIPALAELARAGELGGEHLPDGGALLGIPFRAWCPWFLFLGFAAWIPLVPLHAFSVGALKEAPAHVAILQGGVVRALGAYGLFRVWLPLQPEAFHASGFALGCLGVATIVHGAFTSLRQREWNGVFACIAEGQMGFVLLGVAALTQTSTSGAALQMFTVAAASAALFLTGSLLCGREFEELGGLRRVAPRTFMLATTAILAAIGLPGFAICASQTRILGGAYEATDPRFHWLAALAAVGWSVAAASALWAWWRVFFGATRSAKEELADATPRETCLIALLLAASLVCGIFPGVLEAPLHSNVLGLIELVRGTP